METTEGSTKGKGGLYKRPQIPTLPSKWPRGGVTFHFELFVFSRQHFLSVLLVIPTKECRNRENLNNFKIKNKNHWQPCSKVPVIFFTISSANFKINLLWRILCVKLDNYTYGLSVSVSTIDGIKKKDQITK